MSVKLVPHLWFHTDVQEVADFYLKIFKGGRIVSSSDLKDPNGVEVQLVSFEIMGQEIMIMSAEAPFSLNDSFSFVVKCQTQEEIDYYWDALTAEGGKEVMCGWLKDKYGLSWQIVPDILDELMHDTETVRRERVSAVVLSSVKLNLADILNAYNGN
jgi:predicted 3-demethylubiquinone-9 3-methyltransferase (glyoxalase superfamily)